MVSRKRSACRDKGWACLRNSLDSTATLRCKAIKCPAAASRYDCDSRWCSYCLVTVITTTNILLFLRLHD